MSTLRTSRGVPGGQEAGGRAVERLGAGDLTELMTDVGPVPLNVGAVLTLDGDAAADTVAGVLAERIAGVPRLRQVLTTPPWLLGRPYWADDPAFDVAAHLSRVRCPDPGDHDSLLALAVDAVTRPLPRSRPLWRAVLVTGPDDGPVAVVVVLHHVLADGIGGLAVLGRLVDGGAPAPAGPPPPRHAPRPADLLADRAAAGVRAVRSAPGALARASRGRAELGHGRGAPRCSLNVPTGPRRVVRTVDVDLDAVRAASRRHGATVNDALLVAATGAMAHVLSRRGEQVAELVVSVPVSARTSTTSAELGNRVGVMPVRVPLSGTMATRLTAVARLTRAQKTRARGASAALVGPAFRLLAATGLFRFFVDRQHLVNSFLTNVPGPPRRLSLAGAEIVGIVPITVTAGNVAVAFAALSYAGSLTVTVIVDPDAVPEADSLAGALRDQLHAVVRSS